MTIERVVRRRISRSAGVSAAAVWYQRSCRAGAALAWRVDRISLRSIRATACYSLRDADLPRQPGEYARAGFNTTVFEWRARDRLRSAG